MTRFSEEPDRGVDDATLSRRTLLGGAVGGFVLTASGLYLPDDDEDAVARDGADGGVLGRGGGGKRKRRDRGNKKDKKNEGQRGNDAPPQGQGILRTTALTVRGVWTNRDRWTFTFYYRVKTDLDSYGPWIESQTVAPGTGAEFRYAPNRFRVGVLCKVDTAFGPAAAQAFVDVRNMEIAYPRGSISAGVGLDPTHDKLGKTIVADRDFAQPRDWFGDHTTAVGSFDLALPAPHSRTGEVYLMRVNDSSDFIEYQLYVGI